MKEIVFEYLLTNYLPTTFHHISSTDMVARTSHWMLQGTLGNYVTQQEVVTHLSKMFDISQIVLNAWYHEFSSQVNSGKS